MMRGVVQTALLWLLTYYTCTLLIIAVMAMQVLTTTSPHSHKRKRAAESECNSEGSNSLLHANPEVRAVSGCGQQMASHMLVAV